MGIRTLVDKLFIEDTLKVSHFARVFVDVNEGKTDKNKSNDIINNKNILLTDLKYSVQYFPRPGKYALLPYIIDADIFGVTGKGRIRASDYGDLVRKVDKDPRIKWLLENTNLCQKHFDIAKKNILMQIPFNFDILKYSEKIGTENFRNNENQKLAMMVFNANQEAKKKCN